MLLSLMLTSAWAGPVPARLQPGVQNRPASVQRSGGVLQHARSNDPCVAASGEVILFCDDFEDSVIQHADDHRLVEIDGLQQRWQTHTGDWDSRSFIHGCELQYYTLYGVDYTIDGTNNYAIPGHTTNFALDGVDTLSLVLRREPGTQGYIPNWMSQPAGCWMNWTVDSGAGNYIDTFEYTSGWLQTPTLFRYGRFETRVRIPNEGRVAWPAFWLFGGTQYDGGASVWGERSTEIDVFEFTGYEANRFTRNLHNYFSLSHYLTTHGDPSLDPDLEECTASHWSPTCNFTRNVAEDSLVLHHGYHQSLSVDVEDWHTYAVEWSPDRLRWFMDGQQISPAQTEHIPSNFMTLIINNALPDWLSDGVDMGIVNGHDTSLVDPASFDLDYVKVTALNHKSFTPEWTNQGSDLVDGFYLNRDDSHVAGDFDGDGTSELLSLNPTSGYTKLMDHHARTIDRTGWAMRYDNATWSTAWSNTGNGRFGAARIGADTRYLSANLLPDAQGADDVLSIDPMSGHAELTAYGTDWTTSWSNGGSDQIHWWYLNPEDHYVTGRFDLSRGEDLLALNERSGHAHLMSFDAGAWNTPWSTSSGQLGFWIFHDDDRFVAGDFDNDGIDELLAVNAGTGWAQLMHYDGGDWQLDWSNNGSASMHWWLFNRTDTFVAGDFDPRPGEELLAYNPENGWSQLMYYDNGWHFLWGNGGRGRVHDPSHLLAGDFMGTGGDQLLSLSNRRWAYLERYRLPSTTLSFE